jgi:hypothetical protein
MHDFVAEFLGFRVRAVDVVGAHGNNRVFRGGRIPRYELDDRPAIGRGKPGHPAHVELLVGQPQVVAVETLGRLDISHTKVGENFGCMRFSCQPVSHASRTAQ